MPFESKITLPVARERGGGTFVGFGSPIKHHFHQTLAKPLFSNQMLLPGAVAGRLLVFSLVGIAAVKPAVCPDIMGMEDKTMDGAFQRDYQEYKDINRDFKRVKDWGPLEHRTFRFKKPALHFFCPLCRTERAITTNHRLSALNYIQITLLTGFITAIAFPYGGFKTLAVFFPIWLAFEGTRRLLFSREVPCPHCGFDASWYKRDVKVARKRVAEFWAQKNPAPADNGATLEQ